MKKTEPRNYPGFIVSALFHLLIFIAPVSVMLQEGHNYNTVELLVTDSGVSDLPKPMSNASHPKLKQVMTSNPDKYMNPEPQSDSIPVTVESQARESALPANKENIVPVSHVTASAVPAEVQASTGSASVPVTVEFGHHLGPAFMHRESPHYPLLARRMGKEGIVILRLAIDEKGNLRNIEVVKGEGYGFTEAAVKAVKTSTFRPAMKEGKPVPSQALLPINFVLRDG